MPTDWQALCRRAKLPYDDSEITVTFHDGRTQRVRVLEDDGADKLLRLRSIVARSSELPSSTDPHLLAWTRNRASNLVGFKIDSRGRLVGEAWVPTGGLDADEWAAYVRTIAQACDRLEYLITGRDEA